jgi:hypothetical protein
VSPGPCWFSCLGLASGAQTPQMRVSAAFRRAWIATLTGRWGRATGTEEVVRLGTASRSSQRHRATHGSIDGPIIMGYGPGPKPRQSCSPAVEARRARGTAKRASHRSEDAIVSRSARQVIVDALHGAGRNLQCNLLTLSHRKTGLSRDNRS